MPDINTVRTWEGRTLVDRDGAPVGSINAIYLDDRTGQPEWALVNTGLFGTRSSFVPLRQAAEAGDNVQVPYDKRLIKDAPRVDPDQHLSEAEERQLWQHYGLGRGRLGSAADDAMTRSEEELRVGATEGERGRVRLRRYVSTEQVQQAVPVRRERVRLEHEPITEASEERVAEGVPQEQIEVDGEGTEVGRHERRRRR